MKKLLFLLLFGLTTMLLSSCIAHEHSYSKEWKYDSNSHWYECSCGEKSESLAHTWDEGKVTTAASCDTKGSITYTCTACAAVKVEEIAALGHSGGVASCEGLAVCEVCGEEYGEAIEHQFGTWIEEVPATCTVDGVKGHYTCSVCEKHYESDKETVITSLVIAARGTHDFQTIKHNETHHWYECSCGEIDEINKVAHTWDSSEVTTNPTCEKVGERIYTCVCGETKAEEIAALGHSEEVVPAVAATCTEKGLTEGKKCSVCGEVLVAQTEIPALGHQEEVMTGKAATCTEKGLTEGKKCSVCGEITVAQTEIPALGHKNAEAVIENRKESTCTVAGSYESVIKCSVCEKELSRETKSLPLASHQEEIIPGKAATCKEAGLTDGKKCSVCGVITVAQEEISATGNHNYVILKNDDTNHWYECGCGAQDKLIAHEFTWKTQSAATCLEAEIEIGTCVCQYETTRIGDKALGHNNAEPVEENRVESTCTETGSYDLVVYCSVCEKELSRETKTLPLANHSYVVQFDEEYHWNQCSVCNDEKDKVEHQFDDGSVNEDLKVYACTGCEYQKEVNLYTIKWNIDGDVTTTVLEAGELITCELQPAKAPKSETIAYEFAGWSLNADGDVVELGKASESVTYYAIFNEVTRLYTVEIKYAYSDKADAIESKVLKFEYQEKYGEEDTTSAMIEGYLPSVPYFVGIVTEDIVLNVTYHKSSVWDGSVATAFSSGDGTEENPYIIASAAELAYLKDSTTEDNNYYTGVYFQLGCSIDLADILWSGIGTGYTGGHFGGHFDGAGYAVYNVKIEATSERKGFFNSTNGSIKNLVIEGSATTTGQYIGLLAGISYAYVDNCKVFGAVTSTNRTAGLLIGWEASNNINNCESYGAITAGDSVGGIVGYQIKFNNTIGNVTNCRNYATVTATNLIEKNAETGIGGVVGVMGTGAEVNNCENYGTVSSSVLANSGIGGVVGNLFGSNIVNCNNYGAVTGGKVLGGIVGYARTAGATISNSNNYADVYGASSTAGIVGFAVSEITISVCKNYGNVSGEKTLGGIVGYLSAKSTVSNAFNYGSVNGISSLGGIAGSAVAGVTISDSINEFTVSGSYNVGGICGENRAAITNCVNNGLVTNSETGLGYWIGGIAGMSGGAGTLTSCVNNGNVKGIGTSTGGVAGICGGLYGKAIECTNNATVFASMADYSSSTSHLQGGSETDCVDNGQLIIQ